MAKDYENFNEKPEMAWDLRLTYAMKILTPILESIEYYRTNSNFQKWFDYLDLHLYTNINQKLRDEEKEEYIELVKKTITELNKYPDAFAGTSKDMKEIYPVRNALRNMEMWLKQKMEENNLFGGGSDYDPDEI
jgi:hypothetical protein